MNCFNHVDEVAVASCKDCGKGLCKECSVLYQIPICSDCNLKRVQSDKGNIIKVYLPSIALFILGIVICISGNIFTNDSAFAVGYALAGLPWGWKIVTFIQPRMFLFLSFFGWVMYFVIKGGIAMMVGLVALPIGLVKLIISLVSAHNKEKNINNNLTNNQ